MQPRNPSHPHTLLEEIHQHCQDSEVHSDDELVALVTAIARSEHLAGVWTLEDDESCPLCLEAARTPGWFGPSHEGSVRCESGSVASGGHRRHCACSVCF